jgi:hypothetical protein
VSVLVVVAALLMMQAPASEAPASGEAAASEAQRPEAVREKLLVLDVKSGDLSADQVATLTQMIASRAHRFAQVDAVSSADLRELATLEAEKQEAGCEGDSCLAELAGALGARYVLSTRAGKIGSSTVVSVQLYEATKGTVEARDTVEVFDLDELPAKVSPLVDGVLTQVLGAPLSGAAPLPQAPPKKGGSDPLRLGLQVGGGAGLAVGVVSAALGVIPFAIYQQKKGDLLSLQEGYAGDTAELEGAQGLQTDLRNMRALYNNVGRFAVIGGVTLAVLGGGALAAGFLLPPLDELSAPGSAR